MVDPKRRHRRVSLTLRVDCLLEDGVFSDFSRNISESGICVGSIMPVREGSPVEIKFALPASDGQTFTLRGRVIWCREEEGAFPMGLEFETHQDPAGRLFSQKFRRFSQELESQKRRLH